MSSTDPYVAAMEAQLQEWKGRLDALKARAEKATVEGRIDVHKRIESFEARFVDVRRRIDELRAAGADRAADIKVGLEKALDAFKSEFQRKES